MPPLSMQILCNFNGNIVLSGTGLWFSLIVTLINPYHCCCCCSVTQLCPTLCASMDCNTPGFPVLYYSWSLLKLMSIKLVMLSNHLILCPHLLLPSIFPSIRVFSMSWLFTSGGQSSRDSALASVLPPNIQN